MYSWRMTESSTKKTVAFCPLVSNWTDSWWFWTALWLTASPLGSTFFHFSARFNCRVCREAIACLESDAGLVGKSVCVPANTCELFCVVYVFRLCLPRSLAETYPSKFDSMGADSHAAAFWSFKCSEACLNRIGVKKKKKNRGKRHKETKIESSLSHAHISHEGLPATFLWKIMLTCQSSKSQSDSRQCHGDLLRCMLCFIWGTPQRRLRTVVSMNCLQNIGYERRGAFDITFMLLWLNLQNQIF